jgi:hypothetical protein
MAKPTHPVAMRAYAATISGCTEARLGHLPKDAVGILTAHEMAMGRAVSRQRSGHCQSVDRLDRLCRLDRARLT